MKTKIKKIDFSKLELTYIVPVYQENKAVNDLEKLLNIYKEYDRSVLNRIHFIFVDDCSPIPVEIKIKEINFTLAKVLDDIKWNQGGARNLGVHLSKTSKLILTDLDHIFSEKIFKDLLLKKVPSEIYRFRRKDKNGEKVRIHLNTFFCSKATFFKSLGVDEEFCGNYGYEDVYFEKIQKFFGTRFKKYRKEMITYFNHEQHDLKRDTSVNLQLFKKKLQAIKNKKPFSLHSRRSICFEWQEIKSNWLN